MEELRVDQLTETSLEPEILDPDGADLLPHVLSDPDKRLQFITVELPSQPGEELCIARTPALLAQRDPCQLHEPDGPALLEYLLGSQSGLLHAGDLCMLELDPAPISTALLRALVLPLVAQV